MANADIGLVGLAVMGENLALNMESKGLCVAAYNKEPDVTQRFASGRAKGKNIILTYSLEELAASLSKPRKIWLMIRSGKSVDEVIGALLPLMEKGDILIDGGNSHFADTIRRTKYAEDHGLLYIGAGVSGGEEGALNGPSIMPGGSPMAWPMVKPILQSTAAHVDGYPCCQWVGGDGAGHFVKMVHNGIEYGDMQLICEAYCLMKEYLGLSADEMHSIFRQWNKGDLDSYLIQITSDILAYRDTDGKPMVDKILDTAGQKGTGKWTSITSLDEGVPLTLISEAVYARFLSTMKEERAAASKQLEGPKPAFKGSKKAFLKDLQHALYASRLISYTQGFSLLYAGAKTYGWDLNFGEIALLWRGGCIIRSAFLMKIKEAFDRDPGLTNLLLDPFFKEKADDAQAGWRNVVCAAVRNGIPVPAFSSALSYYDGYRSEKLPANLLQAQRDYFGAHTYERVDRPRGEYHHTNWTGEGGTTSAGTYND